MSEALLLFDDLSIHIGSVDDKKTGPITPISALPKIRLEHASGGRMSDAIFYVGEVGNTVACGEVREFIVEMNDRVMHFAIVHRPFEPERLK